MKVGTAKFVGSRLWEAREARAMSGIALADLIGVSRQVVSQYENGAKSPSPAVMQRISSVLNIPLGFFLTTDPPESRGVVFYRSMSSATKAARARAERRYSWLRKIVRHIYSLVAFPAVRFPEFDLPENVLALDHGRIAELAAQTRRFWGLGDGPISNIVWLLENNGAVMARHDLAAHTLDAFSEWNPHDGRPYIVLGADKQSAARSRFDAAHELGHMVLHRKVRNAAVRLPAVFRALEEQAYYFASAFLMPEKSFAGEVYVPTLDVLRSLKARWGVSIGAMIKRSAQIGLLTPEQEQRLWINRTRRGWRTEEPLDDVLEPESPRYLRRSIDLLIERGMLVPFEIEAKMQLCLSDIEDVCGFRPGYLDLREQETIKLRAESQHSPAWRKSPETGNWVLPFRKTQ